MILNRVCLLTILKNSFMLRWDNETSCSLFLVSCHILRNMLRSILASWMCCEYTTVHTNGKELFPISNSGSPMTWPCLITWSKLKSQGLDILCSRKTAFPLRTIYTVFVSGNTITSPYFFSSKVIFGIYSLSSLSTANLLNRGNLLKYLARYLVCTAPVRSF